MDGWTPIQWSLDLFIINNLEPDCHPSFFKKKDPGYDLEIQPMLKTTFPI